MASHPDPRPLPPGWAEHFDADRKLWYYIDLNQEPAHATFVHPNDTLSPGAATHSPKDTPSSPGPSHRSRRPTVAQQLYASSLRPDPQSQSWTRPGDSESASVFSSSPSSPSSHLSYGHSRSSSAIEPSSSLSVNIPSQPVLSAPTTPLYTDSYSYPSTLPRGKEPRRSTDPISRSFDDSGQNLAHAFYNPAVIRGPAEMAGMSEAASSRILARTRRANSDQQPSASSAITVQSSHKALPPTPANNGLPLNPQLYTAVTEDHKVAAIHRFPTFAKPFKAGSTGIEMGLGLGLGLTEDTHLMVVADHNRSLASLMASAHTESSKNLPQPQRGPIDVANLQGPGLWSPNTLPTRQMHMSPNADNVSMVMSPEWRPVQTPFLPHRQLPEVVGDNRVLGPRVSVVQAEEIHSEPESYRHSIPKKKVKSHRKLVKKGKWKRLQETRPPSR